MTRAARIITFIERYCRTPDGEHVGKPLVLGAADYTNPNVLDDGNAYIRFRNGDPRRIAFDDDEHNVYRKPHSIGADYVYFGNDDTPGSGYIVPWLAMNPGRVVQLPAVPSKGMAGYTDVKINVQDKGAWDYALRARIEAALARGDEQ